ncbi:hypothetical protein NC652_018970 [Populus alba x Populus x berolinensis]|nr:hypothetical protein NC652_018970 [Populus alba x Populus x berolinensis]
MGGCAEMKMVKHGWRLGFRKVLDKDGNPAKPGDLLAVEISNWGPLPRDEWGSFDRENGGRISGKVDSPNAGATFAVPINSYL